MSVHESAEAAEPLARAMGTEEDLKHWGKPLVPNLGMPVKTRALGSAV